MLDFSWLSPRKLSQLGSSSVPPGSLAFSPFSFSGEPQSPGRDRPLLAPKYSVQSNTNRNF